ncbi:hypothetical protein Pcinc_018342, partial [Petrolisthes cinctipes]
MHIKNEREKKVHETPGVCEREREASHQNTAAPSTCLPAPSPTYDSGRVVVVGTS